METETFDCCFDQETSIEDSIMNDGVTFIGKFVETSSSILILCIFHLELITLDASKLLHR